VTKEKPETFRNILLVEDNPGDARLTVEAFKEIGLKSNLHIAKNGEEALDFLYKVNNFIDVPTPDIIMLDLNLPQMDGHEILFKIKNENKLKQIPVIILSTSKSDSDISRAYENHANCFITKPSGYDQFIEVVKLINSFWFSTVKLPG
jgi:two-component system, chemotaxis family, response regulator Rcp1